jgi:hypothetical protein
MVGGQHLAVDEPLRALLPRLHARRLGEVAGAARQPGDEDAAGTSAVPPRPADASLGRLLPSASSSLRAPGRGRGAGLGLGPRGGPAAAAVSPARSPCALAGLATAVAAHRLPTREPGAPPLSMPSAPGRSPRVRESPEARVGARQQPRLGGRRPRAGRGWGGGAEEEGAGVAERDPGDHAHPRTLRFAAHTTPGVHG